MKTKFYGIILIGLSLIGSVYAIYSYTKHNDARKDYETFLNKTAVDIPPPGTDLKKIPKADRPDLAAYQNFRQTLDPAIGNVPIKRQYEAYLQTKKMETEAGRGTSILWEGTSANMGGRTRALMFDPTDSQHKKVWAAGVTGGIWYTLDITDVNDDWVPLNDFYPNLSISSLAYDPNEPTTFYAGTGEAQTARIIYRESSGLGMGILKSTDAGESWELIPSTSEFAYVTDIEVRNENGVSAIYAAVVSGTYQGEDHESQPSDGLYRSTNGGVSWDQVLPVIPGTANSVYAPAMIEIAANNRIFVGTMENLDKKGGASILMSDEGVADTWSSYTHYNDVISAEGYYNVPARTIVASAPSNPNILYAQFAAGFIQDYDFTYYRGRYMAKSIDGGLTWSSMNIPDSDWSTLAWHAFVLKVDPEDPASIFTGGLDLWKTDNSGQSWEHISDWSLMYYGGGDAYVHADQHNIAFRPENPTEAIFSSDGGVFFSENANLSIPTFVERNRNYNTLQFYSADINPSTSVYQFIGGLQDNGSLKYNGTPLSIFNMVSGGDGAFCFWDQTESNLTITSIYYNVYLIWRNNQNIDYFDGGNGTFVSPADYDSENNILYSNATTFTGSNPGKIYRILDIGGSATDGDLDLGIFSTVPFSHIKCSKYAPTGTSTLFVGTESGKLYKVLNAQNDPDVSEIGSPDFPTASISSVSEGGSDDTLMVSFSNYGVSSIWQTYDGGSTWMEREGNLPDMPVRWAMYHPQNSGQALIATETGVWTTNMMHTENPDWYPANDGMGNVRVDMLRLRNSDNMVIAASHGRGVFNGIWNVEVYTGTKDNKAQTAICTISPNPASDFVQIKLPLKQVDGFVVSIYDANGRLVLDKKLSSMHDKISIRDFKAGTYVAHVNTGSHKYYAKFTKSLN